MTYFVRFVLYTYNVGQVINNGIKHRYVESCLSVCRHTISVGGFGERRNTQQDVGHICSRDPSMQVIMSLRKAIHFVPVTPPKGLLMSDRIV